MRLIMNLLVVLLILTMNILLNSNAEAINVTLEYDYENYFSIGLAKETSINLLQEEISQHPENYKLHFILGLLYFEDHLDKADSEFRKVIKINPDYYHGYLNLGYLYMRTGKMTEAENNLKKALSLEPNEPVIYNALSVLYVSQKKVEAAISILDEGITRIKNDESLLFNQSLMLMQYYEGKPEQAKVEANMQQAINISPKEEYFFILGTYYLEKGNCLEARDAFNRALELKPDNVYSILTLATTYSQMNEVEKALEIAKRALQIAPDNEDVRKEIRELENTYKK